MAPGFRTLPVMTGEPSQGPRRRVRLFQGNPFAADRPVQVLTRTNPHSGSEIDADYVRHLTSRLAVPAHRRSVEEQQ